MRKLVLACFVPCMLFFALTVAASDSGDIRLLVHQERTSQRDVLLTFKALSALGVKVYGLQRSESIRFILP